MPDVPERYNVSTLLDANLAAGRAAKVAISYGKDRITYGELFARACAMGRALHGLGVRRGERVLLILDDTPAFAVAFWGAIRIGAVPVPVNPLLRLDDYRYFVEDIYARVVIVEPAYLEKLAQALEDYSHPPTVIVNGDGPAETLRLGDLLADHQGELPPADTHRDDVAFMLYSGGSTGRPKGVIHLHHDIPSSCEAYAPRPADHRGRRRLRAAAVPLLWAWRGCQLPLLGRLHGRAAAGEGNAPGCPGDAGARAAVAGLPGADAL